MWKAKISFRTEDGVVKNHKFFFQPGEVFGRLGEVSFSEFPSPQSPQKR